METPALISDETHDDLCLGDATSGLAASDEDMANLDDLLTDLPYHDGVGFIPAASNGAAAAVGKNHGRR